MLLAEVSYVATQAVIAVDDLVEISNVHLALEDEAQQYGILDDVSAVARVLLLLVSGEEKKWKSTQLPKRTGVLPKITSQFSMFSVKLTVCHDSSPPDNWLVKPPKKRIIFHRTKKRFQGLYSLLLFLGW